MGQSHAEQPEA
jgi:hypothetical protein